MNKPWHEKNVLGHRAPLAKRANWHLAHQKYCACRPIPKTVAIVIKKGKRCSRGHFFLGGGSCPVCWPRAIKKTAEKIQLRHPQGKHGVNIDQKKYESMKQAMLSILRGKELTHDELFGKLDKRLKGKFEGNISWYAEGVKLDLEARKIIERTSSKPQKYRMR